MDKPPGPRTRPASGAPPNITFYPQRPIPRALEIFQLAVRAGIYTADGQLTEHYREDAEPSASRPTD